MSNSYNQYIWNLSSWITIGKKPGLDAQGLHTLSSWGMSGHSWYLLEETCGLLTQSEWFPAQLEQCSYRINTWSLTHAKRWLSAPLLLLHLAVTLQNERQVHYAPVSTTYPWALGFRWAARRVWAEKREAGMGWVWSLKKKDTVSDQLETRKEMGKIWQHDWAIPWHQWQLSDGPVSRWEHGQDIVSPPVHTACERLGQGLNPVFVDSGDRNRYRWWYTEDTFSDQGRRS